MGKEINIELLYFDGCPNWIEGMENLKTALTLERIEAQVILRVVVDNVEATRLKFLGSPSFRINGMDLWDEKRSTYDLSCRVYLTPQGLKGCPTVEMLREKLRSVYY